MVGEELCDVGVEDEAVAGHDGRLDSVVNAARSRLPRQPPPMSVQLESEKAQEKLFLCSNLHLSNFPVAYLVFGHPVFSAYPTFVLYSASGFSSQSNSPFSLSFQHGVSASVLLCCLLFLGNYATVSVIF